LRAIRRQWPKIILEWVPLEALDFLVQEVNPVFTQCDLEPYLAEENIQWGIKFIETPWASIHEKSIESFGYGESNPELPR
jgi:hypothetical protein